MKKPLMIALGLVMAIGLFNGCRQSAFRHGDPEKRAAWMEKRLERALDDIQADEKQRVEIRRIVGQIVDDGKQLRQQGRATRAGLTDAILTEKPDREKIHRMVDEKIAVLTGFAHRAADKILGINSLLTPAQRETLRERFKKGPEPLKP